MIIIIIMFEIIIMIGGNVFTGKHSPGEACKSLKPWSRDSAADV